MRRAPLLARVREAIGGAAVWSALFVASAGLASCRSDLRFTDVACTVDGGGTCGLSTLHCLNGSCVACVDDTHCTDPAFPRCDTALRRCVQCGVATDCGSNQKCSGGRCYSLCTGGCPAAAPRCDDSMCTQCDDGAGCPSAAAPHCSQHLCFACLVDGDCGAATPRCDVVRKSCVQCAGDPDCPTNAPLCDLSTGACVTGS
jgi:hypothetical protein